MNNRQVKGERPTPARGRIAPRGVTGLSKRDPRVARIVLAWRRLTSPPGTRRAGRGSPTLVACSGGADSCALVLALASANAPIVIAHVVHDMRELALARADRDFVKSLAESLRIEFVEADVHVPRKPGINIETCARRLRYDALARLAQERGIRFIATAHQTDDQLETMLMALMRGSSVRGLGGMRSSRSLRGKLVDGREIRLIRPMLESSASVTREDCESLCRQAGVTWRVDATNADVSRFRAAVRHLLIPAMVALRPKVRVRAAKSAEHLQGAASLIESRARRLMNQGTWATDSWSGTRRMLADAPELVAAAALRKAYRRILGDQGLDRVSGASLAKVARAIRDDSTDPRRFLLGAAEVRVDARRVVVRVRTGRATLRP